MEYSNTYKSRHGFVDFKEKTLKITNRKDESTIDCQLIKVPEYSFKHTYTEKICEGNGWYSMGDKKTETITHDFYYLVVLKNSCIGVIQTNLKQSISGKYTIRDLSGLKQVKEFLKTIKL